MSLLEDSKYECVLMNKTSHPDGYGGRIDTFTESDFYFQAAVTFPNSIQERVAEQQGIKNVYTVTTSTIVNLKYGDVFKILDLNYLIRIADDGELNRTPDSASIDMRNYSAEKYVMANG